MQGDVALGPAILILAPVFVRITDHIGIHPIHFGTIVIVNLVIRLITPPVGDVRFIVRPLAGVPFEDLLKEILPFMLLELFVMLLIGYIPILTLLCQIS